MFQKVLVAEDLDSISLSIVNALNELCVQEIHHAKYCDEAYLKIRKAIQDKSEYDLIISDLSFKTDHTTTKLSSGEELVEAVKKIQPTIKIIIFTIEDKAYRIKSLFNNYYINGYVLKGRNSIPQLKNSIQKIFDGETNIITPEISHHLADKSIIEIEDYDISLLRYIAKGFTLDEIANQFKILNISPNSSSSIEKRITKLKIYFRSTNNVHLIAIAKDLGLI